MAKTTSKVKPTTKKNPQRNGKKASPGKVMNTMYDGGGNPEKGAVTGSPKGIMRSTTKKNPVKKSAKK